MKGLVVGSTASLALVGLGLFWWQGRAQVEEGAPPPMVVESEAPLPEVPPVDPGEAIGPAPPEATELTREQRRFFRYDRNRDWKISRTEMLSTRTDAFRKLDTDGNNLLTFEEWAVATANRFDTADADGNGELSPSEFATTRPKPRAKPACRC